MAESKNLASLASETLQIEKTGLPQQERIQQIIFSSV